MTVSSEQSFIVYNGDGTTKTFTIPFYFLLGSDISITLTDTAGSETVLVYGVNFSIVGDGSPSGGAATLNTAPPSGYTVNIYRNPPVTQQTAYQENGKFPAKSHEKALDKLTMLIQSVIYKLNVFNSKSVKVPEAGNWVAPKISDRNNRIFAWDNDGKPIAVLPQTGSASDVLIQLASSADGKGDALISVKQPFTGATPRTQHDFNAQFVSVKDGGAVGDGVTSCGSAFQTVIAANSHVYIPPGDWVIDANILKSSGPLCLRGAGVGVTRLICTVATGTVLKFTPQNGNDFFDFSGFTMVGAAPIANKVQAIHIDGSSQLTATLYRGMQVTGEREKRRGIVHNIDYQPLDSSHGFGKGLRITSLLNFNMHSQSFYGPSGTFADEAYAIDGQGVPVDIRVYDLYAYNVTRAFNMPDYVEALYIKDCDFVGVTEGICNYYQSGRSVIPTSTIAERSNGLKIGPMHTSFKGTQGFRLDGAAYVKIMSCLIFAQNDAQAQKAHIYLTNTNFATVKDNMLVGDASVVTGNASFGVLGDVLTNSVVSGNQANGLLECVHLTDYSVTNVISDNYALGFASAVGVTVQGGNSVQNILRNNKGASASVAVTSTSNSLIAATYASGYNVSLTSSAAGSSQTISVSVPSNIFSSKPAIAMMTGVNGDGLIYEFVPSTSSATSLSFNVRRADSTAISAGTFGVLLFASSNVG